MEFEKGETVYWLKDDGIFSATVRCPGGYWTDNEVQVTDIRMIVPGTAKDAVGNWTITFPKSYLYKSLKIALIKFVTDKRISAKRHQESANLDRKLAIDANNLLKSIQ